MHKLPVKGGMMISEDSDGQLMEALGLLMTMKQSILDLPHGGAYGALKMDKKKYSKREVEAVVRRYAIELIKKQFIGGQIDIMNPGFNTGTEEMNWVKNTHQQIYSSNSQIQSASICTGKSVSQGGIQQRDKANALSARVVLQILIDNEFIRQKYNLINHQLKSSTIFV